MEARAAPDGGLQVGQHQAEDIDMPVFRGECAPNILAHVWFERARFLGAQALAAQADGLRGAPPLFEICRIVLGTLYEKPSDSLHAMRCNGLDDAVFRDAFPGSFSVLDDVAAAGMQQAVTAPGGSIGDVALLQQRGGDAPQTQIPENARARRASTDNDNLS